MSIVLFTVCPSVSLSVCLSVHLPVCLSRLPSSTYVEKKLVRRFFWIFVHALLPTWIYVHLHFSQCSKSYTKCIVSIQEQSRIVRIFILWKGEDGNTNYMFNKVVCSQLIFNILKRSGTFPKALGKVIIFKKKCINVINTLQDSL